ncbi:MAG: M24 family metallopeptidase [Parachlamydiales bacterium]|nr:M24 family metallopeptidase [Parachlamydiales bacterium]
MEKKEKLSLVQKYLRDENIDGWLIYDFRQNNELACEFLELPTRYSVTNFKEMSVRRFFYWIPQNGTPVKILHASEPFVLFAWEGEKKLYLSWQSLEELLKKVLQGVKKVAMEYSPSCAIPTFSVVDKGTIDLVENLGIQVVSSSPFLPFFSATLNEEELRTHYQAVRFIDGTFEKIWDWIATLVRLGKSVTEYDVQQKILLAFDDAGFVTDIPPICAVNERSADPHYFPMRNDAALIKKGDFLLINMWCKLENVNGIYADITKTAVIGVQPSEKQREIFSIVKNAQKETIQFIQTRIKEGKVQGFEADDVCRNYIKTHGYGDNFIHRTGHSIGKRLHGNGAHLDNLETHDERYLLPNSCFSVEPGIYLAGEFGIRSEKNVIIDKDGNVKVSGGEQEEIISLA